jgi:hypothetical protein
MTVGMGVNEDHLEQTSGMFWRQACQGLLALGRCRIQNPGENLFLAKLEIRILKE